MKTNEIKIRKEFKKIVLNECERKYYFRKISISEVLFALDHSEYNIWDNDINIEKIINPIIEISVNSIMIAEYEWILLRWGNKLGQENQINFDDNQSIETIEGILNILKSRLKK